MGSWVTALTEDFPSTGNLYSIDLVRVVCVLLLMGRRQPRPDALPPLFRPRPPARPPAPSVWPRALSAVRCRCPAGALVVGTGLPFRSLPPIAIAAAVCGGARAQYNEMNPSSNDPAYLHSVSSAVYAALSAADADAVWVMQGYVE